MTLTPVSHGEGAGASILVGEDDEQIAEPIRDFPEAEGCQVRDVASGLATSEQPEHGPPDLVLQDVMLPDVWGAGCRLDPGGT